MITCRSDWYANVCAVDVDCVCFCIYLVLRSNVRLNYYSPVFQHRFHDHTRTGRHIGFDRAIPFSITRRFKDGWMCVTWNNYRKTTKRRQVHWYAGFYFVAEHPHCFHHVVCRRKWMGAGSWMFNNWSIIMFWSHLE